MIEFKNTIMGKITKNAIINWGETMLDGSWYRPSEKEADAMLTEGGIIINGKHIDYSSSKKATDGKTYGSEIAAINGIVELIAQKEGLSSDQKSALTDQIKNEIDTQEKLSPKLSERIQSSLNENETSILKILEIIHNNWVKNNGNKFDASDRSNKLYQFVDLNLMTYEGDGAVADLLFLQPIFEGAEIEIDIKDKLREAFKNRSTEYRNAHDITDCHSLRDYLKNLSSNYPTIKDVTTSKGGNIDPPVRIANELLNPTILERMTQQVAQKINIPYKGPIDMVAVVIKKNVTSTEIKNAKNALLEYGKKTDLTHS